MPETCVAFLSPRLLRDRKLRKKIGVSLECDALGERKLRGGVVERLQCLLGGALVGELIEVLRAKLVYLLLEARVRSSLIRVAVIRWISRGVARGTFCAAETGRTVLSKSG